MYTVELSNAALETGRQTIRLLGRLHRDPFPAGSAGVLRAFLNLAEQNWSVYSNWFHKKLFGNTHMHIFQYAVQAITLTTLAVELISELDWVLRVPREPKDSETRTKEQRQFAHDARRLLRLMAYMIDTLKSVEPSDRHPNLLRLERDQRLKYAQHIAELGIAVCKPALDSWCLPHPDSASWLARRARVARLVARTLIHQAKLDETFARTLRETSARQRQSTE